MHRLVLAVTLTVAATIVCLETVADARAVRDDRTPQQSPARATAPAAQGGTKSPVAAHNVTPAARLREERLDSSAIGRTIAYRVLVPEHYDDDLRRFPVLYLLHGLTGDFKDWTTKTNVAEYTRRLPLVIVMPDAENSWYTNSAGEPAQKFEDYLLKDLVDDVEAKFRVIRSRYGRAIAGLSMGGYGALKMALKRPGQFALAGSFSGALAVARDSDFNSRMGAEGERVLRIFGPAGSQTRTENDVFALAAAAKPATAPYIYMDCGTDDGLLDSNRELAAILRRTELKYEYHEVPGAHTWDYWDARVRSMLDVIVEKIKARP